MFLLSGTRIIPGTLSGIATTKNSKSKGNGAGGVGGNGPIFGHYRPLLRFSRIYRGAGALLSLSGTANAEVAGRSAPLTPANLSPFTYCNSTNTLTPETTARISTGSNVSRQSRRSVFR